MYTQNKLVKGWLKLSAVPPKSSIVFFAFFAPFILCITIPSVYGQSAEEEAVKIVIRAETDAWMRQDARAWQKIWVHSPKATRTIVSHKELKDDLGWANFGPRVMGELQNNPKHEILEFRHYNYSVSISDEMAWINFDQVINAPEASSALPKVSREQRVLVVVDGRWKILSQITYLTETFNEEPPSVEASLQSISENLLSDKKTEEAIEVLELNTKLHPQSWNAYNQLGIAYAEAGKKKQAKKCYQKALKLNPDNEEARNGLARLE